MKSGVHTCTESKNTEESNEPNTRTYEIFIKYKSKKQKSVDLGQPVKVNDSKAPVSDDVSGLSKSADLTLSFGPSTSWFDDTLSESPKDSPREPEPPQTSSEAVSSGRVTPESRLPVKPAGRQARSSRGPVLSKAQCVAFSPQSAFLRSPPLNGSPSPTYHHHHSPRGRGRAGYPSPTLGQSLSVRPHHLPQPPPRYPGVSPPHPPNLPPHLSPMQQLPYGSFLQPPGACPAPYPYPEQVFDDGSPHAHRAYPVSIHPALPYHTHPPGPRCSEPGLPFFGYPTAFMASPAHAADHEGSCRCMPTDPAPLVEAACTDSGRFPLPSHRSDVHHPKPGPEGRGPPPPHSHDFCSIHTSSQFRYYRDSYRQAPARPASSTESTVSSTVSCPASEHSSLQSSVSEGVCHGTPATEFKSDSNSNVEATSNPSAPPVKVTPKKEPEPVVKSSTSEEGSAAPNGAVNPAFGSSSCPPASNAAQTSTATPAAFALSPSSEGGATAAAAAAASIDIPGGGATVASAPRSASASGAEAVPVGDSDGAEGRSYATVAAVSGTSGVASPKKPKKGSCAVDLTKTPGTTGKGLCAEPQAQTSGMVKSFTSAAPGDASKTEAVAPPKVSRAAVPPSSQQTLGAVAPAAAKAPCSVDAAKAATPVSGKISKAAEAVKVPAVPSKPPAKAPALEHVKVPEPAQAPEPAKVPVTPPATACVAVDAAKPRTVFAPQAVSSKSATVSVQPGGSDGAPKPQERGLPSQPAPVEKKPSTAASLEKTPPQADTKVLSPIAPNGPLTTAKRRDDEQEEMLFVTHDRWAGKQKNAMSRASFPPLQAVPPEAPPAIVIPEKVKKPSPPEKPKEPKKPSQPSTKPDGAAKAPPNRVDKTKEKVTKAAPRASKPKAARTKPEAPAEPSSEEEEPPDEDDVEDAPTKPSGKASRKPKPAPETKKKQKPVGGKSERARPREVVEESSESSSEDFTVAIPEQALTGPAATSAESCTAESKQDRRKRMKEAQMSKIQERLRERPDILAHLARHQTEVKNKRRAMMECFQRAEECERSRNHKEQLACLAKAVGIANQLGNTEAVAKGYEQLGKTYFAMCDFQNALVYYEKTYKLMEEAKELHEQSRCCKSLAVVYDRLGDVDKEMEYYAKSVKVLENVPSSLEDLREAPPQGLPASALTAGIADTCEGAERLFELGNIYRTVLRDFRLAIVCFTHANQIFGRSKSTAHLQALPLRSLGDLFLELRDYPKARGYLERCIAKCSSQLSEMKMRQAYVHALRSLGRCLLKERRFKHAEQALRTALEKAELFGVFMSNTVWDYNSRHEDELRSVHSLLGCALVEQRRFDEAWLVVENGRGLETVESFRRSHGLNTLPAPAQLSYDSIREFSTKLGLTLVRYAEMETDLACWVVAPHQEQVVFQRLKKPAKRRRWEVCEPCSQAEDAAQAYADLVEPIQALLPCEDPHGLLAIVVSDKSLEQEVPFAALVDRAGVCLGRRVPTFTVQSVAILAFAVEVLRTGQHCPTEVPVGLSDFVPHIAVPYPGDLTKYMGPQHRLALNEWGYSTLLARQGPPPAPCALDQLDV
eukprot:RCo000082